MHFQRDTHWDQPHNWFLLRGLARESGHWGSFEQKMRDAFPAGNLTLLEIQGSGRHRDIRSPLSVPEMARFVRAQFRNVVDEQRRNGVDPEGKRRNFVLCISLGGMVALEWMRQFEGDVDGAVLINTSLRGYSSMFKRMQPSALMTLISAVTAGSVEERESRVLSLVCNKAEARKENLPHWVELHSQRPITVANALRQVGAAMLHRPERPDRLPPLLIMNSRGDRLAHYSCSEDIARRWGMATTTHEWGGHDLPGDDPQWVLEKMGSWRPIA